MILQVPVRSAAKEGSTRGGGKQGAVPMVENLVGKKLKEVV